MDPASQRLVLNQDVLEEIFGHLNPFPPEVESHFALARSARACRAFYDPALDVLWENCRSLLQLLEVFGEVLVRNKSERGRDVYTLRGDIMESQWQRFRSYARRIRILSCHRNGEFEAVQPSIFRKLLIQSEKDILFPSLVTLYWSQIEPMGTELLAFAGESLRRLVVTMGFSLSDSGKPATKDDTILSRVMRTLSSRTRHLVEIEVRGRASYPQTLECFAGFLRLRTILIGGQISVNRIISSCGRLRDLEHLLMWELEGTVETQHTSDGTFPSLKRLRVGSAPDACSIMALLRAIRTESLTDIDVTLVGSSWNLWRACFEVIGTRFSVSLRVLRIQAPKSLPLVHGDGEVPFMSIFGPLLQCRHLQEVNFDSYFSDWIFALTSGDIHGMARSWKEIREICIRRTGNDLTTASIYDLVEFAQFCPNLQSLELGLLQVPPPHSIGLQYPLPHSTASQISVEISITTESDTYSQDEITEIAQFLDTVFPDLDLKSLSEYQVCRDSRIAQGLEQVRSARGGEIVETITTPGL